jgi:hypothetical protein
MPNEMVRSRYGFSVSPGDLGIEIEVEGNKPFPYGNQIPGDWRATTDGSLRGHSIEYVSAFPVKYENLNMHITGLQDVLEQKGVKINHSFRAGVHVHVNVREMTLDEITSFASVYYILEHALVRYCGDSREGNLFCLRLEDAEAPVHFLEMALRDKNLGLLENDHLRYASMNFASISKHGSLEFRAMETTPNLEKIIPWATMLYRIREFSLKNPRTTYGDNISLLGPESWAEQVVGKDLVDLIRYPDFNKDTMIGLRKIQTLLYTW